MPRVPQEQQRETLQPVPGARLTAAPGPETFGANLGEAVSKVGLNLYENALYEADQTVFMEADRKMSEAQTAAQLEGLKLLGKDGLRAPDVAQQVFAEANVEIDKGVSTERQRQAVARRRAHYQTELNRSMQTHAFKESEKFRNTEFDLGIQAAITSAALNATDLEAVLSRQEDVAARVRDQAQSQGIPLDSEAYQQMQLAGQSRLNTAVAQRMLDLGRTQDAKQFVTDHKGFFTPADQHALSARLKTSSDAQEGFLLAQGVFQAHMQGKGLQAPIPLATMREEIAKAASGNPDVLQAATSELVKMADLQNAQQHEEESANRSAVDKAVVEGKSLSQIRMMREFAELSGPGQLAVIGPLQAKQEKRLTEMGEAERGNLEQTAINALARGGLQETSQALTTLRRQIEAEAASKQLGHAWVEEQTRLSTERVHAGALANLISEGKAVEAQAMLTQPKFAESLSPKTRTALHADIEKSLASTTGEAAAAKAFAEFGGDSAKAVAMRERIAQADLSDEARKTAFQSLTRMEQAQEKQAKALYAADESTVNQAIQARRVTTIPALRALPGFRRLSPKDQKEAEQYILHQDEPGDKVEQETTWGRLYADPEALRTANLDALLRQRKLSESAYKQLIERRASLAEKDPETKMRQALRFGELRRDATQLRTADLDAELRTGAITETQYQTLTTERVQIAQKGVDDRTRAKQVQTYETLLRDPKALATADLPGLVRDGKLDDTLAKELARLRVPRQPLKEADAVDSIHRLNDAKTQKLFRPDDERINLQKHQEALALLREYVTRHSADLDYDPKAFTDKLLEPVETSWIESIFDAVRPGQPDLERRRAEKLEQLKQAAGAPSGSAPAPAPTPPAFDQLPPASAHVGKVLRDTVTGERFRSDGKTWQKVP